MPHRRPLPGQRLLFAPPALKEIRRALPELASPDLWQLGRDVGREIMRRKRFLPLALELGLKQCPPIASPSSSAPPIASQSR